MDTSVQGYDTTYRVLRDTVSLLNPDSAYEREEYALPVYDTIPPENPDDPDSDTTFIRSWKALEPDSTPYYDTSWNAFGHDATWQTGVSLSTKLYGLFPIRMFGLKGIRHELTPTLSYTLVPEHKQDKQFFDIGIPYDRGRDRSQRVGIRIDNLFQGKVAGRGGRGDTKAADRTFTILNFGLGTSYDFEAEERKWADLTLDASTSLKFMRVSFGSRFWMYDKGDEGGEITYPRLRDYSVRISPNNFAIGGKLWDGDRLRLDSLRLQGPGDSDHSGHQQWRLSISPSYTFSASRETPDDVFTPKKYYSLSASAGLSFSRNWALSWSSTFDFVTNSFERHSLNFHCDLECWEMVFNWTPTGVQPGYYYFRVNIKKIPDIKWEERE
jgi:hypothetical protein